MSTPINVDVESQDAEVDDGAGEFTTKELDEIKIGVKKILEVAQAWHTKVDDDAREMLDPMRGPVLEHLITITEYWTLVENYRDENTMQALILASACFDKAKHAHGGMMETTIPHVIDEIPTEADINEAADAIMIVDDE